MEAVAVANKYASLRMDLQLHSLLSSYLLRSLEAQSKLFGVIFVQMKRLVAGCSLSKGLCLRCWLVLLRSPNSRGYMYTMQARIGKLPRLAEMQTSRLSPRWQEALFITLHNIWSWLCCLLS
jgi:hypothetical protein